MIPNISQCTEWLMDSIYSGAAITLDVPLVVALDRVLLRSDIYAESICRHVCRHPFEIIPALSELRRGSVNLKHYVATRAPINVSELPYDEAVLSLIKTAKTANREFYLTSANSEDYVSAVAKHLGCFTGWFASSRDAELTGAYKALRLVNHFGINGFDYLGGDKSDLPVWRAARFSLLAHPEPGLLTEIQTFCPKASVVDAAPINQLRHWLQLLRVNQWTKNALVFVPALTAHHFNLATALIAFLIFLAFSLLASAVYIINDIVDLSADRSHRTKKLRPLADGTVQVFHALALVPVLIATAFVIAVSVGQSLVIVLLLYLALTTTYSFFLKRKMIIDVVTLAVLYTLRVVAGGVGLNIELSEWLLAFAMFAFTSLALVKRYAELAIRFDAGLPDPASRDYRISDLGVIAALAGASAFNSVTVFALYASSPAVGALYRRPNLLWLVCPILIYWFARILLLAHRREMNEDPIVFALLDSVSFLCFGLICVVMLVAI